MKESTLGDVNIRGSSSSFGNNFAGSLGLGLFSSIADGFIGSLFGKENYDYQMQASKDYQKWLLTHGKSLEIAGMKAAGLSPAFSEGTGSVGSVPSASIANNNGGMSSAVTALSGALLADKQSQLIEQEIRRNKYLLPMQGQHQELLNDVLRIQRDIAQDTQDASVKRALLDNDLLEANLNRIKELTPVEKQKLSADIKQLQELAKKTKNDAEVSKQAAKLAKEYGIFPGDDGLTALIHVILSGKGSTVINALFSAAKDVGSSFIDNFKSSLGF